MARPHQANRRQALRVGLTGFTGLTLPGGMGDVSLSYSQDGTISLGGDINVPLGNGGFITIKPDVSYGPDGLLAGGLAEISVPGVGDFKLGFKDNKFDFIDGAFDIPLPGGGLMQLDGRLVNTPEGLAFAGDGSVVLPGGMGTFDFDVGYREGELAFGGSGNLNIPLEGGGFISLTPEIDYGPDGISLSGPYSLSLGIGNGQFLDLNGDLGAGVPMSGYNNFCLTCWMFFFM
jgi:hypothetical protein